MKRIYAAVALTFAVAWTVPAVAQSFQWGVVGGLNLSKISAKGSGENLLSSDNRSGWYFGPKVYVSLPVGLAFDGAVEYSQRRLNMDWVDDGEVYPQSKTYRSIEIPINVRYNIGIGKLASVYLATGPQFGFNLGNMHWDNVLGDSDTDKATFSKSNMNTTWNIGAGVKLLGHLEVGVGYNFGIGNIGKAILPAGVVGTSEDVELEYKTNTFQVQVAYMF